MSMYPRTIRIILTAACALLLACKSAELRDPDDSAGEAEVCGLLGQLWLTQECGNRSMECSKKTQDWSYTIEVRHAQVAKIEEIQETRLLRRATTKNLNNRKFTRGLLDKCGLNILPKQELAEKLKSESNCRQSAITCEAAESKTDKASEGVDKPEGVTGDVQPNTSASAAPGNAATNTPAAPASTATNTPAAPASTKGGNG